MLCHMSHIVSLGYLCSYWMKLEITKSILPPIDFAVGHFEEGIIVSLVWRKQNSKQNLKVQMDSWVAELRMMSLF